LIRGRGGVQKVLKSKKSKLVGGGYFNIQGTNDSKRGVKGGQPFYEGEILGFLEKRANRVRLDGTDYWGKRKQAERVPENNNDIFREPGAKKKDHRCPVEEKCRPIQKKIVNRDEWPKNETVY